MTLRKAVVRLSPIAAALALGLTLSACSGTGLISTRTQGYSIPADAVQQIRPGSSAALVTAVLGSPQTTSTFGKETAWYYIETKVNQTAFGLTTIQERTVLAVYFDNNNRVIDRAVYTLQDGRVIAIEQRRTPSFGEDRTFVQQLLGSVISS
ncbi:outer membrane protein assembly factor BamE [Pelagibacterium sediminicola]|uniref:outer membrane protein assembly factor BamE n=1 Tax=Pelagibacterium sediminicola TaxID=2248761 RepID=UPI000E30DA0C|nr:outer membrane protein assembly factor BamE [Pelagibacterium sediminicola]